MECNAEIHFDMVHAELKGKEASADFVKSCIESNTVDLFDPTVKMKLKAFASMRVKKLCSLKELTLTLKADRDVFTRLLILCGKREIALKEVLSYSLCPNP